MISAELIPLEKASVTSPTTPRILISASNERYIKTPGTIGMTEGIAVSYTHLYPSVLGRLLGDKYWVKNFGVSARTMLNKGDRPYMKEQAYQQALAFNPNIVVIKLGTNDSKSFNWVHKADFIKDTQTMIDAFALSSSTRSTP